MRGDLHGVAVLVCDGAEVACWPLRGRLGLAVVDEVARLQLSARRNGCAIRLRQASPGLCELLDLAGLAGVVPAAGLGEVGREAEGGEQAGVEEVVVADDPIA